MTMAIYTYPLFGSDDPDPDPARYGICWHCGDLTEHPSTQVCQGCAEELGLDEDD